ncbi:NACHT domain-containing protein [Annulohypoxylon bovei var. microspora]|nr:NACHT domain-containing protein [Annulohypoxylon bovei var. microspora]
MTNNASHHFRGKGISNSGSGTVSVGGNINIGDPNNCLADLYLTDPRHDKERIEKTKGGLLHDSYCWVLHHADFLRWRDSLGGSLLWIKGDPGKGKTMLLCGIIDELKQTANDTHLLSFFFCQTTDERLNDATAILRGLIYHLAIQRPSLLSHMEKEHEHKGKALFQDVNSWVALNEIFKIILQDPSLPDTT